MQRHATLSCYLPHDDADPRRLGDAQVGQVGEGRRQIPVAPETVRPLRAHGAAQAERRLAAGGHTGEKCPSLRGFVVA